MALVLKDRVKETTSTAGTGSLTLAGAAFGFQAFSVVGDGNTTYYAIVDAATGAWEVGVGTYTTTGPTLTRDSVLESSIGGGKVDFAANIKDVFCTYPAEQAVTLNDVQTLTNKTINLTSNTLVATSAQIAAAVTDETGSGALVFANSPTLVTPALGTPSSGTVTNLTGTASININGTVGATTANTGAFTTLTTSSTVTLNGGTANGVAYLDASKVLTTGSALTFDGSTFQNTGGANFAASSGNVGVGTNTPSYKLDINGTIRAQGFGASSAGYVLLGSGATESIFGGGASNVITFSTNSTGTLSLGGDKSINILGTGARITGDFSNATLASRVMFQTSTTDGTTSVGVIPNGTALSAAINLFGNSDITNTAFAQFRVGNDTGDVRISSSITGTGTYRPITFYTGGSERVRIDTSGNVGIGTSSPGVKADINGVMRSSTWSLSGTGVTGGTAAFAAGTVSTDGNWGMFFRAPTGSGAIADYSFRNSADVERMRIDSSGNVGIGTSSPGQKLQVEQNQAAYTYIDLVNTTNGGGAIFRQIIRNIANTATTSVDFAKLIGSGLAINNNDTNAANFTSFGVGASERMRIDSSGNVGIGISYGTGRLNTSIGSAGANGAYATNPGTIVINDGGASSLAANGGLEFKTSVFGAGYGAKIQALDNGTLVIGNRDNSATWSERMRIDSSGNVGVGTSSPTTKLDVNGNIAGGSLNVFGTGVPANGINNVTTNALGFFTNSSERARIDSSGNLLVGTTSTFNSLNGFGVQRTGGDWQMICARNTAANAGAFINLSNGTTTGIGWDAGVQGSQTNWTWRYNTADRASIDSTTGNYSALSDARAKENVVGIDSVLDAVVNMRPVRYNMVGDEAKTPQIGFIAQEMLGILPEVVSKPITDDAMYGLNYAGLTPVLVKAIQEQQAIITALTARVQALESN
jgi:hypothetical protein